MNITKVEGSGNDSILRWAIKNGTDPGKDKMLANILQEEILFQVYFNDVNFFELFRLTQVLRDRLRVVCEYEAEIPNDEELKLVFPGTAEVEGHEYTLAEIAKESMLPMYNLSKQMLVDSDIISKTVQESFIPMICRKFDIIIPFTLLDILTVLTEDDCKKLFTEDYPNTLKHITEDPMNNILSQFMLAFVQLTEIIRYSDRFNKYINLTKYKPLSEDVDSKEIFKIGLLGCHKHDPLTNGTASFRTVPAVNTPEQNTEILKRIATIRLPLVGDFVIQIPINYMQKLENTFSDNELPISYESSMQDIIDTGLEFDSFITPEEDNTELTNKIDTYKIRIKEALNKAMIGIQTLIPFENKIGSTNIFAILPSIMNTKAVVSVDNKYRNHLLEEVDNPVVKSLIENLLVASDELSSDIKNL